MIATKVYEDSLSAYVNNARIIANKGGTRSGKTYSVMSLLLTIILVGAKKRVIDIISESIPHLKRGAIQDLTNIVDAEGMVEGIDYESNQTDKTYTFKSGSQIRFYSADDWGKVKGAGRDILFINECNRIPYEVFRQLSVRTRECIFLDWNPDSEFWYELKGISIRTNTVEIHSTYKDNPFITEEQIAEIESNKDDENWWKVYGLGLTGRPQGVVYTRWKQVPNIPAEAKLVARGLDFGFTVDPTGIVDVYMLNGELWLYERCYMRGMTNDKIADELRGLPGSTVADSAEQKSITEIYNYGIRGIEPAEKGADSVRNGIQILQRYNFNITSRSLNLIYEIRNYKWRENKMTGELLNEPIDTFNHLLDAVRYVALNYLKEKRPIRRPRSRYIET